MQDKKIALELKNITKVYPNGTVANSEINFKLQYGQIHVLFGENGSGKTTLVKNILGENKITSGEIRIDDQLLTDYNSEKVKSFDIAAVHQHFTLIDNFSVFENVILGYEQKDKKSLLKTERQYQDKLADLKKWKDNYQKTNKETEYQKRFEKLKLWKKKQSSSFFCYQKSLKKKVNNLIDKFNLNLNLQTVVDQFSVNKKQKTEILKTLFKTPKIIIFDEPTSVISASEIKKLLDLLLTYKKMGKAIIFISHKIEEIRKIADWVTVLRRGKVVGSFSVDNVSDDQLINLMVGNQTLSDLTKLKRKPVSNNLLLKVNNLSLRLNQKQILNQINFVLKKGEIVGIAGLEENGQKQLLESIVKVQSGWEGEILYQQNVNLLKLSPTQIKKQKIAYVPQDRQKQGLVLQESIAFNTFFNNWDNPYFFRFGLIRWNNIFKTAAQIVQKYYVHGVQTLDQKIATLSGGNQQKFIVGRELETKPLLFLLHEPMWGIDAGTINYLSKLLIDIRNQGQSVLFTSSELSDILALSDRVLVISKGQIVGEVNAQSDDAFQQIGKLMTKEVV